MARNGLSVLKKSLHKIVEHASAKGGVLRRFRGRFASFCQVGLQSCYGMPCSMMWSIGVRNSGRRGRSVTFFVPLFHWIKYDKVTKKVTLNVSMATNIPAIASNLLGKWIHVP